MPQLTGKFVWFECVTSKAEAAQRFYGEVLGWKVENVPMGPTPYAMIKTGDQTIGGYAVREGAAHWVSYLSVADVDAAAKKVEKAGGKIVEAPFDIPTVGRMAGLTDPGGARLNLFRSADGNDPPDVEKAPPGAFYWNELWTRDARAALAFYEGALGFTHEDMNGEHGVYHILKQSGGSRGGIMQVAEGAAHWLPYVGVDDCDGTLARAKKQGGSVEIPGTEIPNIGRFGVLRDPNGARLGIIKPSR